MILKSKKFCTEKKINHSFFSRKNGFSKGIYSSLNCGLGSKDEKRNVLKNINFVKKKIKAKQLCLVHQVHSNKIIELKRIPKNFKQIRIGKADGIFTGLSNVGIGILTADCAPILFFDNQKKFICCVHAGWKGAFKNIVKTAVLLFKKNKISPQNINACVGPCIGEKSYEIKIDFLKKIIAKKKSYKKCFIFKKKKIFFNLRKFITLKLLESAISKNNISHIAKDTYVNKSLFYSYRRSIIFNKADYGRNISTITKYN